MAFDKVKKVWSSLFPSFGGADAHNQNIPPGGIYEGFVGDTTASGQAAAEASGENGQALTELPYDRRAQYIHYEAMSSDPTISSALLMHISHALSAKSDTGEIISIESIGDEKNPFVLDLRNTLAGMINENCQSWAFNAAKLGSWYLRVYGEDKKGITLLRSDYYTHPRSVTEYCRAGQLVGFISAYQQPDTGGIELMPPWSFVPFKIPVWKNPATEPFRVDAARPFDISNDDFMSEAISETQNYGHSLLESAYGPWTDLMEAIISLNMSRKNAARLERQVGVNTGRLDPKKAALYLNIVAEQFQKTDRANAQNSLRKGWVQTVVNHFLPIFSPDGKGRLDISTLEGNANIDGIQDVMFHVQRLGSALGIDPSLLGFGELMSGGLGDGGFFRVSVLAAMKAAMLRKAVRAGVERLCEIHIAYKYGKVFLPGEKPWRVVFNSVSTALEREERENLEGRIGMATGMVQMVGLYDQTFATADMAAFGNYLWTDVMKVDEEKFGKMFPKSKANAKPPEEGGFDSTGAGLVAESASLASIEQYANSLYQ
jgi:hypothetical protein